MSESELQSAVLDLACWEGFLTFHVRDSRKSTGPGFPDLILVHQRTGRVIAAELKAKDGRLSDNQRTWLDAFGAGSTETYLWRPADWQSGAIQAVLRHARKAVA